MRITVVGTGYLGATHAACLAELGHDVLGLDANPAVVTALNEGSAPFHEPGLDELLARGIAAGRLRFSTDPAEAASFADVHFLCVGTPESADGSADLSQVHAAVDSLTPHLRGQHTILGKSTVPVGTCEQLQARVDAQLAPNTSCAVAWNPEFLRESTAVADTLRPDRIVLGAREEDTPAVEALARAIYAEPLAAGVPLMLMDPATAELVKTSANAFLATKLSFINAVAEICEATGGDVTALSAALGADPRIGPEFLRAGLGYGGGCLPKDVRAFRRRAEELGAHGAAGLMGEVDRINEGRRDRLFRLASQALGGDILGGDMAGKHVAVLGAAFKPGSDDVRESPGLEVARKCHAAGAVVRVYDPQARASARAAAPELHHARSLAEALNPSHGDESHAELVILATEWPEFIALDPATLEPPTTSNPPAPGRETADPASSLKTGKTPPTIIDGRGCLDPQRWRAAGWRYWR